MKRHLQALRSRNFRMLAHQGMQQALVWVGDSVTNPALSVAANSSVELLASLAGIPDPGPAAISVGGSVLLVGAEVVAGRAIRYAGRMARAAKTKAHALPFRHVAQRTMQGVQRLRKNGKVRVPHIQS